MDELFAEPDEAPEDVVPDERLRLVFLCCHSTLSQEAQAALTLRLVCSVTTPDIARLFLVTEATMAARITRAKKKIVGSRIPYRVPRAAELPDRLRGVLAVIYLLFTTGHTAPSGDALVRVDLVETALRLVRMLRGLMPDEPEVRGLLALLLVTAARRATRVDHTGRLLRLEEQDRARWNQAAIAEAHERSPMSSAAASPDATSYKRRSRPSTPRPTPSSRPTGPRSSRSTTGCFFVDLAILAERAAGVPFVDLVQQRVCAPANMVDTAYLRSDALPKRTALGYLYAEGHRSNVLHLPVRGSGDGGAYTTVADIHRLWQALLNAAILDRKTLTDAWRPRSDVPTEASRYGLGFWLHATGPGVMLEGYDAGVSFRTVHDFDTDITHTVIANWSNGAWPLTRALDQALLGW